MAGRFMGGKDRIIKQMILHSMECCSVCGRELQESDLRVLGHQHDMWFLIVICHNCRSQGLLAVSVKEERIATVKSDPTREEETRLATKVAVTADDVLAMHQFLEEFGGDFAELFGEKR